MITKSGPKVIEYNCRFGDPECQTIMPLMDKDFVIFLQKCAKGNLENEKIKMSNKFSGCVIATSKGYPQNYEKGFPIHYGNINFEDCQIFDSGTSLNSKGEFITDGGRVLVLFVKAKILIKFLKRLIRI